MKFRACSTHMLTLCLVLGIFTNICVVLMLINGYNIFNYLQKNQMYQNNAKSCDIDVENLMNLIESRKIQNNDFSDNFPVKRPDFEKTVQTSLFALPGTGLGNKLFELLALRGISDTLKRRPVINAIHKNFIDTLFTKVYPIFPRFIDQFDFKIIEPKIVKRQQANFGRCCVFDDPFKFSNFSEEHILLDGHYFQSYKYFHHLRREIRQWLAPSSLTAVRAGILLPPKFRNDFIICPHIRRGDFQFDGVHQPSDPTFTRRATDYLVEQYLKTHGNVTVVVLGNDIKFAEMVFQDRSENLKFLATPDSILFNYSIPENSPNYKAIITPTLTPEIDLAFSGLFCDVTLITAPSSTFGFWISYLSKPSAITYYRDIKESKDGVLNEMREEDFYPPDWIKLETSDDGKIRKSIVH